MPTWYSHACVRYDTEWRAVRSVLLFPYNIDIMYRMKYPLAMVNQLIDIYGPDIACGYDIACAFSKTLAQSSLGPHAAENRFRLVLGWFHRYGHNALCQIEWHPRNVKGMGRADFEGCERIFSASNAVASLTRHATKFHHHQAIEQHFSFWDEDKYAQLSKSVRPLMKLI